MEQFLTIWNSPIGPSFVILIFVVFLQGLQLNWMRKDIEKLKESK